MYRHDKRMERKFPQLVKYVQAINERTNCFLDTGIFWVDVDCCSVGITGLDGHIHVLDTNLNDDSDMELIYVAKWIYSIIESAYYPVSDADKDILDDYWCLDVKN